MNFFKKKPTIGSAKDRMNISPSLEDLFAPVIEEEENEEEIEVIEPKKDKKPRSKRINPNSKKNTISSSISDKLAKEIEDMKEITGIETTAELIRISLSVHKTFVKLSNKGMKEIVAKNNDMRYHIYIDHLLGQKKD